MKQGINKILVLSFFIFLSLCFPSLVQAQEVDPGPGPDAPTAVPIDGGLVILLAAGAGYGLKKYRNNRRKEKEENRDQNG
jgi:hypothetical protein